MIPEHLKKAKEDFENGQRLLKQFPGVAKYLDKAFEQIEGSDKEKMRIPEPMKAHILGHAMRLFVESLNKQKKDGK